MPYPSIPYRSAIQTDAARRGRLRLRYPLPPQSPIQLLAYAFDQEYQSRIETPQFPPFPKNTPFTLDASPAIGPNYNQAIFTGYSQPSDIGAGLGNWSAAFNIVPAPWDDFTELTFDYPGFPGQLGAAGSRDPFSAVVPTRIRYDYFVIDPDGLANGIKDSAGTPIVQVNSRSEIPIIPRSFFFVAGSDTDVTNSIVPAGGKQVGNNFWFETVPNYATYLQFIAYALANAWESDVWNGEDNTQAATAGQLIAADSQTEVYAGNIIQRATRYVLIQ